MGAGLIADPEIFVSSVVGIKRRFVPDERTKPIYEKRYAAYRDIYENLRPVFDRAADGTENAG
jgi:sugar (pentulose or hexulose) kinase